MSAATSPVGAPYYPVFLDLRGRRCLVVGGGAIAEHKARGCLDAGARVTVVAPDASDAIRRWHVEGRLAWVTRPFQDDDVTGAFVVVAATDDRRLNAAIYRLANERGCVANAVDDLVHCNFIAPAVAHTGGVQVAVSTSGQSPALAKQLRDTIAARVLTPSVATLSALLGAWRPRVSGAIDGYGRRRAFWEGVLEGCIPRLVTDGAVTQAEAVMAECVARARSGGVFAACAANPALPADCRACRGGAA